MELGLKKLRLFGGADVDKPVEHTGVDPKITAHDPPQLPPQNEYSAGYGERARFAINSMLNFGKPTGVSMDEILDAAGVLRDRPMPPNLPEQCYDGALIGANSAAFAPGSSNRSVPGVLPQTGASRGRLFYINGIRTPVEMAALDMQAIADHTKLEVVTVHSSTYGTPKDLMHSAGDWLRIGHNPAVGTLVSALREELDAGTNPIRLIAHSRGALIVGRAIADLKQKLVLEDGMSKAEAEKMLGAIVVYTAGSPARLFPKGPQYHHLVNKADMLARVRSDQDDVESFDHRGDGSLLSKHGLIQAYLGHLSIA